MPVWLAAALWGGLAGSALLLGAALGWLVHLPRRVIAGVMAFGGGVLISALSFELMGEAVKEGGFRGAALGFAAGVIIYSGANVALARFGGKHRKRSNELQSQEKQQHGGDSSGAALFIGALIDGIPESVAIGVGLLQGGAVRWVTVVAVFISNVPEGLSSAAGMKRAGRTAGYIVLVWTMATLASAAASLVGAATLDNAAPSLIAAIEGVAAGGILAMVSDTMIPEAFDEAHNWAGLITAAGFLVSFGLSHLG